MLPYQRRIGFERYVSTNRIHFSFFRSIVAGMQGKNFVSRLGKMPLWPATYE